MNKWLTYLGRILCFLGLHDFKVIEVTFGFGGGPAIEKVRCERCGLVTARQGS